jgi:hypothetical protein
MTAIIRLLIFRLLKLKKARFKKFTVVAPLILFVLQPQTYYKLPKVNNRLRFPIL